MASALRIDALARLLDTPRLARTALVCLLSCIGAAGPAQSQDLIFSDDFESGTVNAWTVAVGLPMAPDCVDGRIPSQALEGDLGPAPTGGTDIACLSLNNDRSFDRSVESAFSGVPIPRGVNLMDADLARLVLVGPGNRRIPGQFNILSRWGGPLDDGALPARWLQVTTQIPVAADGSSTFVLRRLDQPADQPQDSFAATLTPAGENYTVDTGVATFTIDPDAPELIAQIRAAPLDDGIGRQTVYTASPGAGPRMVFRPSGDPVSYTHLTLPTNREV